MNESYNNDMEYWEFVSKKVFRDGKIYENFDRKRLLVSEISKYDLSKYKILEIGCGHAIVGFITQILIPDLFYVGFDLNHNFLKWNHEKYGLKMVQGRCNFLPFKDKYFDAIFIFDVLEHINPAERRDLYFEMDRVTNNTAMIFINNPVTLGVHDKKYDYGFNERDLGIISESLNSSVTRLNIIESKYNVYQFITLEKHKDLGIPFS